MNSLYCKIEFVQTVGVSSEANIIKSNYDNAVNLFVKNSIYINQEMTKYELKKFIKLKNRWKKETLFFSSGTMIITNSAYREIISMGIMTLPWIFNDLKRTNSHWFYALEKITGQNPIQSQNIGIVEKMKEDWIIWAKDKEII